MNLRKDRLKELYDYLRQNGMIHTKRDMAKILEQTEPSLYSAFSGNESYLTDSLFKRICAAFPGIFNLNYLLTGEGTLLADHQDQAQEQEEPASPITDYSLVIEKAIEKATAYADRYIANLEKQVRERNEIIAHLRQQAAATDALVASLRSRISELESQHPSHHPLTFPS